MSASSRPCRWIPAEAAIQTDELRSSTEDDTRLLIEALPSPNGSVTRRGACIHSMIRNLAALGLGLFDGHEPNDPKPHESLNAILTYANVRQKRVLSVFDEDDSNILDGLGVFACRLDPTRRIEFRYFCR